MFIMKHGFLRETTTMPHTKFVELSNNYCFKSLLVYHGATEMT